MKKNFYEVFGYTNPAECLHLQEFARGRICLEIGCFLGKSTVAMAEVAKKVYSIDTFKENPDHLGIQKNEFTTLESFQKNIKGYDNIKYFIGESGDILPGLDIVVDCVFIDGDHSYSGNKKDILFSWPKLRAGGMFVLHDYYIEGVSPKNKSVLNASNGVLKASREIFGDDFIEGHEFLMAWFTKKEISI